MEASVFRKMIWPEVLDKMIAADVIVMATPVYFYTMNAQMKTLIDRTCSRYTEIRNKEFYFIVAAADSRKRAMERTMEGFRAFTSCLSRAREKGIIYGTGAWKKVSRMRWAKKPAPCQQTWTKMNTAQRSGQGLPAGK
ncbi:MAG: NAD(P)H-dependent oxidoreductase [Candidatus Sulfobium sp.]